MVEKKITTTELKQMNKNRIYRFIYEQGEISRQELAIKLSLSLPTVNQNLKELEEQRLIEYAGSFESTGGRKAQVIIPRVREKLTVGIDICKTFVRVLLIDLCGNVVDYEKYLKSFDVTDEYCRYLAYLTDNIIKHNNLDADRIIGVGISIPGVFDKSGEYIVKAPSLLADHFEVGRFKKYMKYPVIIDNDANGGAFTEYWKHPGKENRIYLSIEKGIGGCFIQKGGLYKGFGNKAGEFGHMTIVPHGRECNCGKRGCFEAYLSMARISEDLGCQIEDFFVELENGNEEFQLVWEEYLEYFCIGINNLYTLYDSEIILGGGMTQYLEPYLVSIRKRLKELNSFESNGEYLRITEYQSKASAIGVALQHVKAFMDSI